jgi:heat-inducible transcriptional repressor
MTELSDREIQILRAVVTEYIDTGAPVGSRTLSRKYGLALSPASIRNVLADLEDAGLLYQPHTSAGRLPTERAFRLFVTELMSPASPTEEELADIQSLDAMEPGVELLRETGRVLSKLANTASVVVAPRTDLRRLTQLHFIITREPTRGLLAVLLFADGSVETRYVDADDVPAEQDLEAIHNVLAGEVRGKTLQELRDHLAEMLARDELVHDEIAAHAAAMAIGAAREPPSAPIVVIEGQSRLLEQPEFADAEKLRELARVLEEREMIVLLLDKTIRGRTVNVLVGTEAGNLASGQLSIVAAPFTEQGGSTGAIGVLGSTRMNYPKVLPLVSATARAVSSAHVRRGHTRSGSEGSRGGSSTR